jgi:hypothetical protein
MQWMEAVPVNEHQTGSEHRWHQRTALKKTKTMKTLNKIALVAAIFATTFAAKAEWVTGHLRSSGAHVTPYYRTPANGTPYDNLTYRGYPSQQPGYISPPADSHSQASTRPKTMPYHGDSTFDSGLLPSTGIYSPKPLYRRSTSFGSSCWASRQGQTEIDVQP